MVVKLDGYHGTFANLVNDILRNGFNPQKRDNHWLGQGSYFYTNKKLAFWFISKNAATDYLKKEIGNKLAIIHVNIEENRENILDLDDPEDINDFYKCINEMYDYFKPLTFTDDKHKNLCLIIDVLAEIYNWNIIIKTFEHAHKPSYGAVNPVQFDKKIFPIDVKYKEKQICVRNNKCIKIMEVEYPDNEYIYPSTIYF
ncbi:hypothetical protein NSQ82_18135 [Caldifermentibacillus hisashii]|uniref:hypothetical protein n=1 Tax=Bacillaceae TaxID=186817 RepID=UPI000BA30187|nr:MULTISPECIES: hypothetical protein [Bacillaceae]MCB7070849.1 hypothetical protein [Caldibacillus sp. 210928-DFI.2.22]MCB7074334.1 hypothetical protein [Caldibacillus sp. 210928-DFI.2.18]MCM3800091.1 hypothetical protein [Caldibacillus thermoamylovorans]MEC5273146.1 hypothetical protein [Caldifermentibacillus hisashii]PAC36673.1 hypothetical protein CEJ87_05575 [Caldifermentibacillus hisashii]